MATIKCVVTPVGRDDGSTVVAVWGSIGDSDTCSPLSLPDYLPQSFHVSGTFNSATVVLKGSNTGVNYVGLNDRQDTPISMTSEGLEAVQECCAYYQPASSGGSASSTTVTMLLSRATTPRGG